MAIVYPVLCENYFGHVPHAEETIIEKKHVRLS